MNIDELLRRAEELENRYNTAPVNVKHLAFRELAKFQENHGPAIARALSVAVKEINEVPHAVQCHGDPCVCWKGRILTRIDAELKEVK